MTASALPVKTRNATMAFLTKFANGYIAQIDAQPRPLAGNFANNWQSHRVKLVAMIAFTLDNRKMIATAQRLFVEHIGDNVARDGSTLDFTERDALHYVTYDLQPLVTAALAARRHNRNWLTERAANGVALAAALFAPVVIWNARHGWASFGFQVGDRAAAARGFSFARVGRFVGLQALLLTPVLLGVLAGAAVGAARRVRDASYRLCAVFALPALALFLAVSTFVWVKGNWPAPA
jgi:hypothetical protein